MVYSNNFGQSRVGVRNRVVNVVNSVDADAIAFIAAAGITNLTQAAAINTLVNDLKTYGLWTKMKALYPMVGGTATSHKFNLKDPRDLDAAYRLVFNGGWTHTSTGALPNGTNGYANTRLAPQYVLASNNSHLSFYSRSNTAGANRASMGSTNSPHFTTSHQMFLRFTDDNFYGISDSNTAFAQILNTNTTGYYVVSRTSNNSIKAYKNSSLVVTNTTTITPIANSYPILISARNDAFTPENYDNKESAFASIGDGLTDAEATNFYNSVQKFQTTLGRQIGSPIVSDTDAQAFINAAGLTDLGQANAVNTLVIDLKDAGVWTKMKALYPFVGGTATTHKWNLKDPRDLNEAFRLVFTGGWTHTSTGALPNGSNGYANTYLVPSNNFTISQYDAHISLYSRTNIEAPTTNWLSGSIGVDDDYNSGAYFVLNVNSKTTRIVQGRTLGNQWTTYSGPLDDSRGFFIINKQNNTTLKLKKNDTLLSSNTTLSTGQYRPAQNFYIGAVNGSQSYSGLNYDNKEYGFISIGNGLTDTESTAFYTAVQKYQTSLSRQIGTPVLADGQTAGLLETYSGAAAAYSLRKLRTGYVGNAIRVRRSSDNAEQDIAFDANGNLDTASLLSFVGTGNGFVSVWFDQSGNNRNATQVTTAYQPKIVSSGILNTYNSKPCVKFDGSDDFIQSPYATGTSNEMYFVTQTTDTGFLFPRGQHGQGFIAEQGSTNTETSGYWTTQPQLYVNSILRSPSNRNDVYNLLNGYKLSLHKGANISNNFIYLRFGSFIQNGYLDFNGNLFEWIIYPTLQSSQSSIESNINTYYTIY